jgi:hypothetical protein
MATSISYKFTIYHPFAKSVNRRGTEKYLKIPAVSNTSHIRTSSEDR